MAAKGRKRAAAGTGTAAASPKADAPPTIAFVTTCKGRLHHLKQTLPTMAAQNPDELIVVDYDCQDGTGDWVEANVPQAKVVRASQPDGGFNVGRARNLGAAAATSEWLFFVDADIALAPPMLATLRPLLRPGRYYRALLERGAVSGQAYGNHCCRAEDFAAAEGYDEVMEGWGYEDRDLYDRFAQSGLEQAFYPASLLRVFAHDDQQRHLLEGMRSRAENEAINGCYSLAKRTISGHRGGTGSLPLEIRHELMGIVRAAVGEWYTAGARAPLPVRLKIAITPPFWLASSMRICSEVAVTVVLQPPTAPPQGAGPMESGRQAIGT